MTCDRAFKDMHFQTSQKGTSAKMMPSKVDSRYDLRLNCSKHGGVTSLHFPVRTEAAVKFQSH